MNSEKYVVDGTDGILDVDNYLNTPTTLDVDIIKLKYDQVARNVLDKRYWDQNFNLETINHRQG